MLRCPDVWARAVSEEMRGEVVPVRVSFIGPWAKTLAGPDGCPGSLFIIFFSSFLFSPFLFSVSFITLQIWFKLIQINL
jgi:hypothetical protein